VNSNQRVKSNQRVTKKQRVNRKQRKALIGVSAVVLVGVVVALVVGLGGGSSKPALTHVAFARLWTRTVIGTPRNTVLSSWPKPYQTYPDGFRNQCFEWWDKPLSLYNLCFHKGVLVTKSIA
jgi:hypothetical protein